VFKIGFTEKNKNQTTFKIVNMIDETINITDENLLAQFIKGDNKAFDEMIGRYYQQIYRFLVRFTSNEHLAQDLIQEVFMKVHRAAATFDTTRKFKPWLYQVAANKARDAMRSAKRSKTRLVINTGTSDSGFSLENLAPGQDVPPEQDMVEQETTNQVKEAMAKLPEQLREILILAYYDQLPYKDIAEVLGIPLGTVKSRLHKAVGAFGEVWKRYEASEQQ
jgi:RNA polymerase sigma-70 factor, ECF subfamily